MCTLDKLLTYGFTPGEKEELVRSGIVNGCGAKGGFNFSKFIDDVQKFAKFKSEKLDDFKNDMREVCSFQHDVRFYEGGSFIDFCIANFEFVNATLALLHWTSVWRRAIVAVAMLAGLSLFGYSAFNFGEKRDINEIFKTA